MNCTVKDRKVLSVKLNSPFDRYVEVVNVSNGRDEEPVLELAQWHTIMMKGVEDYEDFLLQSQVFTASKSIPIAKSITF